jgi:uncharacterized protein with HEPN domain
MTRAPLADRLRHMLEAVARIETLTIGKTPEDHAADWVMRDAVEFAFASRLRERPRIWRRVEADALDVL